MPVHSWRVPFRGRPLTLAVLFAIPVFMPIVSEGSSELYTLLAIAGLITWYRGVYPEARGLTREERLVALGCIFFTAIVILSIVSVALRKDAIEELDVLLRPLLIVPILLLLIRHRPPEGLLWYAMAVGSIVIGIAAIAAQIDEGEFTRAEGVIGANTFGRTAAAMGFMTAVGWPYFRRLGRRYELIPLVASVLALVATILSGSRGVWVALPAMAILLVWNFWHPGYRRIAGTIVAGGLLVSALAVAIPQSGVQERIGKAVSTISLYMEDPERYGGTPIGQRFEMWRAAGAIIERYPVLGAGTGNSFNRFVREGIAEGEYHPKIQVQTQVHNVFLQALVSGGLLGLAGLLALWGTLAYVFAGAARRQDPEYRALGVAGIGLIVLYAISGLTDSVMSYGRPLTFFCLLSALIVHWIAERRATAGADGRPAAR